LHNPSLNHSIHDFQTHAMTPINALKSGGKYATGRISESFPHRNPL
jgi:hypothetical protein